MNGQAHGVVGEGCDDPAVEKAATVAVGLGDDDADRDRLGFDPGVERPPRIGDRAAPIVDFESFGHNSHAVSSLVGVPITMRC